MAHNHEQAGSGTGPGTRPGINRRTVHNRVPDVMRHIKRYWFEGRSRLAEDAGVSRAAITRFLSGRANPSYAHVHAIREALERRLGVTLDVRELVSMDGTYPTPTVCQLLGCKDCCPPEVYESEEFSLTRPGQFSRVPAQEGR